MDYTPQQQLALQAFEAFLDSSDQVFILKGYAGTGKTTLVAPILSLVESRNKVPVLMAPTGRAAKILSEKTRRLAATIHKTIYTLSRIEMVEGDEQHESSIQYHFPLKDRSESSLSPDSHVHIVDEASMVGSKKANDDLLAFGSGVLLDDLLEYASLAKGGKILFIGDPAQLPPVGDNESPALTESILEERGLRVRSFVLTEVLRQGADSAILANAVKLRDALESKTRTELILERKEGEVEDIEERDIPARFKELAPEPSLQGPVVISFSNADASAYNARIRELYFPGASSTILPGDRIIVTSNNYSYPYRDIMNGEFAMVLEVSPSPEDMSGVVYVEKDGKKTRTVIQLRFRDVVLQFEDGAIVSIKLYEPLLYNVKPNLSYLEQCALFVNFKMRHGSLKSNTEDFSMALRSDPYYNAVRAKFGYAITGHKSQGGEWDTTFVDFKGRLGYSRDCLRWSYTAATRARRRMFGHLMHRIPWLRAEVSPVKTVSKVANEYYPSGVDVPTGPFHDQGHQATLKGKYWKVAEALEGSGYCVSSIDHLQYRERYHITDAQGLAMDFDSIWNNAGVMQPFRETIPGTAPDGLLELLNNCGDYTYPFSYKPSNQNLGRLYNTVLALCDEHGVSIMNIVEHPGQYRVLYYLRTDAVFAYLEVFVNKLGEITNIVPKSASGDKDEKLKLIARGLTT